VIRPATEQDVPAIVAMCAEFHASTEYHGLLGALDPSRVDAVARHMIADDEATVLLAVTENIPVGMLAITVYEHPFTGERYASELVWWVEPAARGGTVAMRLLRDAERWAADQQVAGLQMIAPNQRVGDLYARVGYAVAETTYLKRM
jgi:GNAT superfamily N-acetyltransferase